MGFVKLNDPGASLTLHVIKVEENKTGNWPDWEFHGADGNVVAVPQKACERQFARLNVASALQLVGANLKISRSDKPGANGKLFWNLDLSGPPAPASKRVSAADADPYVGVPALPDFPRSQGKPVQRVPAPQRPAPSHGGPLPGEDEVPEDVEAWMGGSLPESPDGFEAFSRAVDEIAAPAQTPRETADAMLKAKKRHDFLGFYAATFAALKEMLPDGTSDEAVQSAVATCVIQFGKVGLLP
jgi:hypothetical protein